MLGQDQWTQWRYIGAESRQIPIDRPVSALPVNESKFLQLAMATAVQLVVLYSMNDESTCIIILKKIKED